MVRLRKLMLLLLLLALGAYAAILAVLYFAQTSMLFPARLAEASPPLRQEARALALKIASGDRLRGVHIPASEPGGGATPVILGFGGNAWNGNAVSEYLAGLFPSSDVVVFHFRGYRPSGGSPSAAALIADAPFIHDFVADRFPDRPIVAVGFSIGTGVAASLARQRNLAGVILVTPFDTLAKVAGDHYPWIPVRPLFRHEMKAAEDISRSTAPVALLAAGRDQLIGPKRTAALRAAVPTLVFDRTIADANHNSIYDHPEFRRAMADALAAVSAKSSKS